MIIVVSMIAMIMMIISLRDYDMQSLFCVGN